MYCYMEIMLAQSSIICFFLVGIPYLLFVNVAKTCDLKMRYLQAKKATVYIVFLFVCLVSLQKYLWIIFTFKKEIFIIRSNMKKLCSIVIILYVVLFLGSCVGHRHHQNSPKRIVNTYAQCMCNMDIKGVASCFEYGKEAMSLFEESTI